MLPKPSKHSRGYLHSVAGLWVTKPDAVLNASRRETLLIIGAESIPVCDPNDDLRPDHIILDLSCRHCLPQFEVVGIVLSAYRADRYDWTNRTFPCLYINDRHGKYS